MSSILDTIDTDDEGAPGTTPPPGDYPNVDGTHGGTVYQGLTQPFSNQDFSALPSLDNIGPITQGGPGGGGGGGPTLVSSVEAGGDGGAGGVGGDATIA